MNINAKKNPSTTETNQIRQFTKRLSKTVEMKGVYYRNEKLILAGHGGAHL